MPTFASKNRGRSIRVALRLSCVLGLLAGLVAGPATVSRAASQTHTIEVHSNVFVADRIFIAPGDVVRWKAFEAGHTVTADDGRFDFYPHRTLKPGEEILLPFAGEETIAFHCRIHGGQGMRGVIVVGAGSPAPAPVPTRPREERRVPTALFPTITDALDGIPEGSLVRVAPGVYNESVMIRTAGVTVAGDGPGVVLDGRRQLASGVVLGAGNVTAANLTVRDFTEEGVAVRVARAAVVRDVVASDDGQYGMIVSDSQGALLEGGGSSGASVAGVAISGCSACGVVVQRMNVTGNLFGVLVDNAGGSVIRQNILSRNGTGIVARTVAFLPGAPQTGAHIYDNDVQGSGASKPEFAPTEFSVRSGIWIAGGFDDVVESNRISGGDYGVLVSSFGVPSMRDRIVKNVVSASTQADLGWDGTGSGVCFSGNTSGGTAAPSSSPPRVQTIYSCESAAVAGVPNPLVIADLARYAVDGAAAR
ncbi:MAG: hypothetical protein NVSMB57_06050 [Actinomycetota bacterium]